MAYACDSCKGAIENSQGGGNLAEGFFWSILFMLAMPPLIFGSFVGLIYYKTRQKRRGGG